jgi:hypothetical protein
MSGQIKAASCTVQQFPYGPSNRLRHLTRVFLPMSQSHLPQQTTTSRADKKAISPLNAHEVVLYLCDENHMHFTIPIFSCVVHMRNNNNNNNNNNYYYYYYYYY